MEEMLHKIRIIYKGDRLTAKLYLANSVFMLFVAIAVLSLTTRIGFFYLGLGLLIFAIYSFGKGLVLRKVSKSRYDYYTTKKSINNVEVEEELEYNTYRLNKKNRNRRYYIYATAIASAAAFAGIFMQNKGVIVGTFAPIALLSAMEFSVGLMVEFRLWEYQRILHKYLGKSFGHEG